MKLIKSHEQAKSNHIDDAYNHHDSVSISTSENRNLQVKERDPKSIKFKAYHPKMMIVYNCKQKELKD